MIPFSVISPVYIQEHFENEPNLTLAYLTEKETLKSPRCIFLHQFNMMDTFLRSSQLFVKLCDSLICVILI